MKKGVMVIYERELDMYGRLPKTRIVLNDHQLMDCLGRALDAAHRRSFKSEFRIDLVKYISKLDPYKPDSRISKTQDRVFYDISSELIQAASNIMSDISMGNRRITRVGKVDTSSLGLFLPLTIVEYDNNLMLEEFIEFLRDKEFSGEAIPVDVYRLIRDFENNGELFLSQFYKTEGN